MCNPDHRYSEISILTSTIRIFGYFMTWMTMEVRFDLDLTEITSITAQINSWAHKGKKIPVAKFVEKDHLTWF